MDGRNSPDVVEFRREVVDFFEERRSDEWLTIPPDSDEYLALGKALDTELIERGWYTMHWPTEFGGQSSMFKYGTLRELEGYYRAPSYGGHGRFIVGPALLRFGTQEQQERYLPPIAAGELTVCEGFSEADAGSDLSAMRTTAIR